MRGHGLSADSVDIITRVLRAEFPELDAERLRGAVERAVARVASSALDAEGYPLVDIQHDDAAQQLSQLATAWQQVGRPYYAADCLERVLLIAPADAKAFETLEVFYRSTGEWPVLIDLLGRRAMHVDADTERGEL